MNLNGGGKRYWYFIQKRFNVKNTVSKLGLNIRKTLINGALGGAFGWGYSLKSKLRKFKVNLSRIRTKP